MRYIPIKSKKKKFLIVSSNNKFLKSYLFGGISRLQSCNLIDYKKNIQGKIKIKAFYSVVDSISLCGGVM
jgi:hypothetical protein